MKPILNLFQILLHSYNFSLGFLEHISKDFGSEKRNPGSFLCNSSISSNLNNIQLPVINTCIGGCGRIFKGYKRHACPKCFMKILIENIDRVD